MIRRFQRFLPTRESIKQSRFLQWLGPRLHDPDLWRVNHRAVARGVAIGAFFGLLVPIAQIPIAALFAFLWRANLWVAAATTLITNPFTFGPLYYGAYKLGAFIIGAPDIPYDAMETEIESLGQWLAFWWARFVAYGRPLALGLILMAAAMSVAGYYATMYIWRLQVMAKRRRARKTMPTDPS